VPIIGLREDQHLQPIVRRLAQVEEDFMNYTDHQRIERVWGAISAELTDLGVPLPTLEIGNFAGVTGQFRPGTWLLQVNASLANVKLMERANTNRKKEIFARLGDTMTHEARHCEQLWRCALLVITRKWLKDNIKPTTTQLQGIFEACPIALGTLQRALVSAPLSPASMDETAPWYDSIYGGGSGFRNINLWGRQLRPVVGGTRVGGGTEDIGGQFQLTEFARYEQGLAEEADAHATGRRVQELYLQGSGVPVQPLVGHVRPSGTH
jgi:hypothetical protein